MTHHRLTLATHSLLELLAGLALLALPLMLGLGPVAFMAGVAAGAVVAGIGLAGGDTLSLARHQALDQTAAAALVGCAVAMVLAGEAAGAALFAAAAAFELTLLAGTRWTRR